MNKSFLIGNLTRDPELKTTASGVQVCTFTIAVNGKKDTDPQFFRCTAWRQLAENCQRFLAKGRKAAVVGAVTLNTYKKANGEQGASLEVNADEVEFLSPKDAAAEPVIDNKSGMIVVDESEPLPF